MTEFEVAVLENLEHIKETLLMVYWVVFGIFKCLCYTLGFVIVHFLLSHLGKDVFNEFRSPNTNVKE